MKELGKMATVLFTICAISAGALSLVYRITYPKIQNQIEEEKKVSFLEVLSEANNFKELHPNKCWIGDKNGKEVGYVIDVVTTGYSGEIEIIVGLDLNYKVTKVKILRQTETPGLGTKIKEQSFLKQFENKTQQEIFLTKDSPSGKIDAISGATISSRAVTNAIREAIEIASEQK